MTIITRGLSVSFRLKRSSKTGIRARYSNYEVLKNINLEIVDGDRVALLGVNGAGKTTLLRVLSGVLPPTKGSVQTVGSLYPALSLKGTLMGDATVLENILLRGKYIGLAGDALELFVAQTRISADLDQFLYQPIRTLSKGMRSRLIIALFVITPADIYIFDEWIGVMDRTQFIDGNNISSIIDSSKITVLASHKLALVKKYCNRGIVLEGGEVVCDEDISVALRYYKENIS